MEDRLILTNTHFCTKQQICWKYTYRILLCSLRFLVLLCLKDCDKYRLQPHIEGCLVHGRSFHAYVSLEDGHDSSMVINCLLATLCQVSDDGVLPPTLYIQLDNCWRENKNRYFIGFMAFLVAAHIFKEVNEHADQYIYSCQYTFKEI